MLSLLNWYKLYGRDLPWRQNKDPYQIWLSEIILQQTRVEQGRAYYERFLQQYPTVTDFAKASLNDILLLWQGLGYYSRARNMHFTAQYIVLHHQGVFPNTIKELLQLKGVGTYTAAAIASFAFDIPIAVVDGNVYRILSRYFGVHTPIDTTQGKRYFEQLAQEVLPSNEHSTHNQAIMDFGAMVCTPKPKCNICPLIDTCQAFLQQNIKELPVKTKKKSVQNRFFYYLVIRCADNIIIRKRTEKDIWHSLYDFPLIETSEETALNELSKSDLWHTFVPKASTIKDISAVKMHKLTHQNIYCQFLLIVVSDVPEQLNSPYIYLAIKDLDQHPYPIVVQNYIADALLNNFN